MWISDSSLSTILNHLSIFVFFLTDVLRFINLFTFLKKVYLLWFSSNKSYFSLFFHIYRRNWFQRCYLTFLRKRSKWIVIFSNFSHYFAQRICTENIKHFLFTFIIFALSLDDKEDTINHFSFQGTICIIHFNIKNLESSLGGIIKLRGSPVGMHNKVNQDFFDFIVFSLCKALNDVLYPNFSMIFHILPY